MDINKILNNKDLEALPGGISAGLNILSYGFSDLLEAMNYNPYKVNIQNQTYSGKALMKNGGKLNLKKMLAEGGPTDPQPNPKYSWNSPTAPTINIVTPKETGTTYTENRLIARPAKIKLQTSNDNLDIRTPEEWKAIDNAPNVNISSIQSRPQNGAADYTIQEMSDWNARQELAKNIKKGVTAASFIPPLTLPALAAQTGMAANDSYRSGNYTPLATQALGLATLGAISKIPGVNNALNSAASEVKSFANQALGTKFVAPLAGIELEASKNLDKVLENFDEKILKPNYLNEGVLTSAKTIEKEGRKILNDLSSKEGIRRLSNQFKKANPNLTKSELDTLVQNRLKEVESAIEYNDPRYLFQEKAKDILTPEVVREFYPKNNAYWTKNNSFIKNKNLKGNLSNISDEDIDYSIFEPDAGTKKFLDPNYSPGAITLGENLEKNIKVLDHEIGHATAKGGKLPIDDELKKLISPGQKRSLLEKVFNPLSKESIDDKNYFDFAGYRPIENERYPFLVEQRRHMMENGILSNRYDKVTPKKLLQARISAMLDRGPNYVEGNRLIKFTPFWKYPQLADIMNQAPAALPAGLTGAGLLKAMQSVNKGEEKPQMAKGGMLKRKDGSYSRRGLWDNIRANRGSGKEPTKEMLAQEKKIKNKLALGGDPTNPNPVSPLPKRFSNVENLKDLKDKPAPDFEDKVDKFLGYPQDQAWKIANFIEKQLGEDEWNIDPIRHANAGRLTAQNLQSAMSNYIPNFISAPLAFAGANALGIGHELTTLFKDERPWADKLRESGEDIYNNSYGAKLGALGDPKAQEKIEEAWINNRLPDGQVWAKESTGNGYMMRGGIKGSYKDMDKEKQIKMASQKRKGEPTIYGDLPQMQKDNTNIKMLVKKMAEGGKLSPINIKPENRGKFTAAAERRDMGVQEFASKVLANKEDYSSTMVKRANFAKNAASWKKAEGGPLDGPEDPTKKVMAGPTVNKSNQNQSPLLNFRIPQNSGPVAKSENWIDRNSQTIDNVLNIGSLAALVGTPFFPPLGYVAAGLRGLNATKTGYDVLKSIKKDDYENAGVQLLLGAADIAGAGGAANVFKSGSKFAKKQIQSKVDDFVRAERAAGRTTNQINAGKRRLENQLKAEADLRGNKVDRALDITGAASDVSSLALNNKDDLINMLKKGQSTMFGYLPKMQVDGTSVLNNKMIPTKGSGGYLDKSSFPYGGIIKGPSHENGGVNVNENGVPTSEKNAVAEVEGGEYKYTDPITGETYIFSDRLPYKKKSNGKKN